MPHCAHAAHLGHALSGPHATSSFSSCTPRPVRCGKACPAPVTLTSVRFSKSLPPGALVSFDNLDIIRPDGFLEYDELQKGMRKFIRPKNAPSRGGGLSRGDPLNRVGAKPSRLAKLQGAKSQGSLASASVTSSTGGFDAFSSVYSYDSIRPTTAVWEPKRYDWKRDFQARWPYLT